MIFTLPNYKMKDCQTVKYDCWGGRTVIDLLSGGSMEELGEFARRMHEVQGTGMLR